MKFCSKCGEAWTLDGFSKDKTKKDGRHSQCKACMRETQSKRLRNPEVREKNRQASRAWRQANPDRAKASVRCATLRRKYGITAEQFDEMFSAQGNKCAICEDTESKGNGMFHVDHDHKTKAIRGILCQACNVTLGKMKDSPELLRKAAAYLEINYQNPIPRY